MKKTTLLIILVTTFFKLSFGQTEEEKLRIDTAVNNAIKSYFEDPSKFQATLNPKIIKQFPDSGNFENGLKTGLWIEYTLDSLVSDNGTLVIGDKQMPIKTSYFIKKDIGKYQKGMRDGNWILYQCFATKAPFDFERRDVRNYKNGKLDGEEIYYQGYGIYQTPLATCYWKDGIKDGIAKEFDYNYPYKLQQVDKIIDGKVVLQQTFYSNGKLKDEQTDTIINGQVLIYAKHYFEGGQLNSTGYFINNADAYGTWTYYYENGKVESMDNKINGNHKYYFDNGQLCFESINKNGKLMEVISNFTIDGKKNDPGTLKNGTGTLRLYDPDGKLKETVEYIDGIEKK